MRRQEGDRLKVMGALVRPHAPHHSSPDHHFNHHSAHIAANWIHELTDLPVNNAVKLFERNLINETKMSEKRLNAVCRVLLRILAQNSDHFTAAAYASIYHHLSQGLIPKETDSQ